MRNFSVIFAVIFTVVLTQNGVAQNLRCFCCEDPYSGNGPEWDSYWTHLRSRIDQGVKTSTRNSIGATQLVFLDFESGNDGAIEYTQMRRDDIQSELEQIFERFNVNFTQKKPGGIFSTLVFNEGGAGGGRAEDIDFRNLNLGDNAVLNVDGIGIENKEIVPLSTLIAAHELGHLLGLRHADMFGPIGQGVLPGFGFFYEPVYDGPDNAFEAVDHVMVTGAFGIPFSSFINPSWFSERSTVKLTLTEFDVTTGEIEPNDGIQSAQPLPLQPLKVPNTIVEGVNASNSDFSVDATVIVGSLDGNDDPQDIFQIEGRAGDLLNLQVISSVPDRLSANSIDAELSVFDGLGNFVDYYGNFAFNQSELKSDDCNMIDLILPEDGTYFVEVDSPFTSDAGDYELFIYRFNGIIGDLNGDGVVDLLDVGPFVDALTGGSMSSLADVNCDGEISLLDVGPFVDILVSK